MSIQKIIVQIKPNSRESKVEKIDSNILKVWVKSPPVDGRANEELIESLAHYYKITKSSIEIKSGHHSKKKIISISN